MYISSWEHKVLVHVDIYTVHADKALCFDDADKVILTDRNEHAGMVRTHAITCQSCMSSYYMH